MRKLQSQRTSNSSSSSTPASAIGNGSARPSRRSHLLGSARQTKFLLMIRLIVKSLEAGSVRDRMLASQVRTTVRDLVQQHRAGGSLLHQQRTLQSKLDVALRNIVGDDTFAEASFLVEMYFFKKQIISCVGGGAAPALIA